MRWKTFLPLLLAASAITLSVSQYALVWVKAERSDKAPRICTTNQYQCKEVRQKPRATLKIRKIVWKTLLKLQNPSHCKSARKLICIVQGGCGHGCLIHHIGVCLFLAVGTNRTLQLHFDIPTYTKELFETAYKPLSETCNDVDASELETAPQIQGNGSHEITNNHRTVTLKVTGAFDPFTPFAPLTLPTQLKSALTGLHDVPHHWWIGQVLAYVTRLQPSVQRDLELLKRKLDFSNTIVGVHIRRSDKLISEAKFIFLDDYMCYVTNLSRMHPAGQSQKNNVFLATDDPDVYNEAKKKYPAYNFLNNQENSLSASLHRETVRGFLGIVQDIQLLSECQQFVGTFSSNVGRLVYTLMLAKSQKDSVTVCTLDDDYMYYGSVARHQEALTKHKPPASNDDEIELQEGDQIYVNPSRYKCNRRCFGTNDRTRKTGFYPADKVREFAQPVLYQGFQWDGKKLY